MQSRFAFDIIVINFPYGTAAQSSALHITELKKLWNIPSDVTVLVTSNPGVNMGSGGDTIAALSYAMQENDRNKSILIIHAVGDSSHFQNEMIFSMARSSLANTLGTTLNSIAASVHCLSKFYCNMPRGSVMVVLIDIMASFMSCPIVSTEFDSSVEVLEVGVPVSLEAAWNHCVYVFSDESEALQLPQELFQKPTRETKHELHSALIDYDQPDTWVDTGIIIFLPNAAKLLQELSMGPLKLYTETCIQSFLQTHNQEELRLLRPSLDMYAHILQAINCTSPSEYLTFYPEPVFKDLLRSVSTLDLSIVTLFEDHTKSDSETHHLFLNHSESSSEPEDEIVDANSTSGDYNTLLKIPSHAIQNNVSIVPICQHKKIENKFRHELQHEISLHHQKYEQNLSSILLERKHHPCILPDDPKNIQHCWEVVDDVLLETLQKEQFDITSRCFMIHQNWVLDILTRNGMKEQKYVSVCSLLDSCNDFFESLYGPIQHKKNCIPSSSSFEQYCKDLIVLRDQCLVLISSGESKLVISSTLSSLRTVLQEAAALLTKACIGNTFHFSKARPLPKIYEWVVASAPARIDIAGGWTDTPPISYEYGGAVCNLAVTIDRKRPFIVKCHKTTAFSGIKIVTLGLTFSEEVHIHTVWDLLSDYYDLFSGKATLVKSALICLGLIPASYLNNHDKNDEASMKLTSVQPLLEAFLSTENCGMEIETMSNLPQGSGMGGSSILGGCILAAIGRIIGLDTDEFENDKEHSLLHAVLALEQIMTSGGGWQDQVGGIMPGFKITKSVCNVISPLKLQIESIPCSSQLHDDLCERMVLVFTGKARVAKNILQNVLQRWSRRSSDIMQTVKDLVKGAESAAEAIRDSDVNGLGRCIKEYWEQKKIMTGGGAVEPPNVKKALHILYEKKEIVGGTLCGAGGGGFLLLLAREGRKGMDLKKVLEEDESYTTDFQSFTWHECTPQDKGLTIEIFKNDFCCRKRASDVF